MALPDPTALYRKLTSGDQAGITAVGTTLTEVKTTLRTAIGGLRDGASTAAARWQGDARTEFVTRATDGASTVAETYRQLHTADAVVRGAAQAYGELRKSAETAIRPWRAANTEPEAMPELALRVTRDLMSARHTYEGRLTALATTLDGGGGDWTDLEHVGDGKPWIPQGLAYRENRDQLLVTSYNEDKEADSQSRLTLVDNATGEEEKYVDLGGKEYTGLFGQPITGPAPNHVGGVATHGDNVWVTSTVDNGDGTQTNQIYVYSQKDIDRKAQGQTVHPKDVIDVPASSYVSYADGKLWIGQYSKDGDPKLYGFNVNKDGGIRGVTPTGEIDKNAGADVPQEYPTPQHVQGVVVRDDEFVFSQSDGENGSSFITQDRDWDGYKLTDPSTWDGRTETSLGENADGDPVHGVEEIEEIDGELVAVHESGANAYPDDHEHHDDITRTPLEDLGLTAADGYQTDPSSLSTAAGLLDESADGLQHAADVVSRLQLVPRVLGDVPAAATFSDAVTRFLTARGHSLSGGAQAVRDTSDGLIASADTYRRLEDGIASVFGT